VIHDQGGEYKNHLEKLGIDPTVTAREVPWQSGTVERRGQVLADIISYR
jgi:hypothetical protein